MNEEQKIKLALLDDEALIVDAMKLLLATNDGIELVFSSTNGQEFMDYLDTVSRNDAPEIVLLDISMKPIDGFQIVDFIQKSHSYLKIIILSSHYRVTVFGQMIKLGVAAFVPKSASQKHLFEAIYQVSRIGAYFSMKDQILLAKFVKNKSNKKYFNSSSNLTKREIEILRHICQELTSQEISEKVFLSKRTVEGHRQNILDKIGAKNTAGIVIFGIMNDLFRPNSKYFS